LLKCLQQKKLTKPPNHDRAPDSSPFIVCNKVFVEQSPAGRHRHQMAHLFDGVPFTDIVATGKFINIFLQVLWGHFVVCAFMSTLEH